MVPSNPAASNLFRHGCCLIYVLAGDGVVCGQAIACPKSVRAEPVEAPFFSLMPEKDERSEEHASELQSLLRISYAVFCLKKKQLNDDQIHNSLNTRDNE